MIRRQLFFFVLIGGTQLAADCLIFFLLVSVGVNVVLGNVVSRFSAACIGYILNSTITFRSQTKNHLQKSTALRYLSVWLTLTLTSSLLIILLQSAHREIILVVGKPWWKQHWRSPVLHSCVTGSMESLPWKTGTTFRNL